MTKEYCAICDSENIKLLTNQTKHIKLKRPNGFKEFDIDGIEFYKCNDCGEGFYTPQQSKSYFKKLNEYLDQERRKKGLLTADEIKEIRMSTSLTQMDFEKELGLPKNTIVRWETNKVNQSQSADILLRAVRKLGIQGLKEAKDAG